MKKVILIEKREGKTEVLLRDDETADIEKIPLSEFEQDLFDELVGLVERRVVRGETG